MSQLKKKSEILREAAELLHQEGLFPAVAHSAYYSCLQLGKHLWLHLIGKTEVDLDLECAKNKKGTHAVLINVTRNHIKNSGKIGCTFDSREFNTKIGELKRLREDADYVDIDIIEEDSAKALLLSNDLYPIINKYL